MLADAEQWRRLFDTGVTSDSPEAQRLAAQIMDKNIKAKAAKAQVPQDAEGTGRHAVVRHARRLAQQLERQLDQRPASS